VAEQMNELKEDRRHEAKVYRQRLDTMADFLNALMLLLNMLLKSGKGGMKQIRGLLLKVLR